MARFEIVDVRDEARFEMIPPCADPSFDHRTCDYWEDADRGSKASRPSWRRAGSIGSGSGSTAVSNADSAASAAGSGAGPAPNPFAPTPETESNPFLPTSKSAPNPFASAFSAPARNPFLEDLSGPPDGNPLAPRRAVRPTIAAEAPRKLQLLGRGLAVFGTYAKLLLIDGEAAGYCQFGPLSAYPRALRLRELYPQLPDAPLPAVITCIATTAEARRGGHALKLVEEVCGDLAGRGFAAVEAYPEARAGEDATPAARPEFWIRAGFRPAVDDDRYPVVRREL
jgi:ribosomal protein S18 acetylase RimI-like enzyme